MAAKRTSRSPADPPAPSPADPPQPRKRAAPRRKPAVGDQAAAAAPASDTFAARRTPDDARPMDASSPANRSESMSSEPSEEDIRLRAYHRYLERGGGHGLDFDDWLEAERELKTRRG